LRDLISSIVVGVRRPIQKVDFPRADPSLHEGNKKDKSPTH
jgi:hypothetical protein